MGWWITLAVLAAVLCIPLGVRISYDSGGFRVWAKLAFLKIALYPRPPRKTRQNDKRKKTELQEAAQTQQTKEKRKSKAAQQTAAQEQPTQKKGGSLGDFLPFARLAWRFLGDFRRKLRVDNLYVHILLAGGDPADLAVNYGKTWAALGNLQPQLERVLRIRRRDIRVCCDFTGDMTMLIFSVDLSITLGRTLFLGAVYGVRAMKEYLQFQKKRKGGAKNESEAS